MSFDALATRSVRYRSALVRNIKSIHQPQALFDDLAGDAADTEVAMAAEAQSRLPTSTPLIERPFDYSTVITHAFDSSHWLTTRFSDATRYGVWYGSVDLKTTVYETAFHWHRFLQDSFADVDRVMTGERRVFDVACQALLVDLRRAHTRHAGLVDRRSYAFCQRLGRFLHDEGANGLLVRSARHTGVNGAIFRPERLSNVRDRCRLTYRTNPREDRLLVERTPGRTWLRLTPSELA